MTRAYISSDGVTPPPGVSISSTSALTLASFSTAFSTALNFSAVRGPITPLTGTTAIRLPASPSVMVVWTAAASPDPPPMSANRLSSTDPNSTNAIRIVNTIRAALRLGFIIPGGGNMNMGGGYMPGGAIIGPAGPMGGPPGYPGDGIMPIGAGIGPAGDPDCAGACTGAPGWVDCPTIPGGAAAF